jgi:hypothetical protein
MSKDDPVEAALCYERVGVFYTSHGFAATLSERICWADKWFYFPISLDASQLRAADAQSLRLQSK